MEYAVSFSGRKNEIRILIFALFLILSFQMAAQPTSWVLNFGSVLGDQATAITEDQSGDIITVGMINDSVNFSWRGINYILLPRRGNCFISKQDANGQLIWIRHIGGSGSINVRDVATDAHDNFYITGSFTDTVDFNPSSNNFDLISTDPQGDVFVAKYDNWGNLIWAKSIGGTGNDYASSIIVDQDSNVFIAGSFEGIVDFDPGLGTHLISGNTVQDAFLLKLDHAGSFMSVYPFGGLGLDFCTDLKLDNQGNLMVSGNFEAQVDFNPTNNTDTLSSSGSLDAFILKVDRSLSFLWVKKIGGTMLDAILAFEVDDNGNIYIVGTFEGNCDFDLGLGVRQLVAGNKDGFVLQLSSAGNYNWVNKIGGSRDDQVNDIAIDHQYNVYATGYFRDTVDFDPDSSISFNLVAQGNYDHYISQLDTLGSFSWVQHFTGNIFSASNRIFVDNVDNLYTVGSFQGTVDFDPFVTAKHRTAIGQSDVFIQRHTPSPLVDILELKEENERIVKVYPNPSQDRIKIYFEKEYKTIEMKVYDLKGILKQEQNYSNLQLIETDIKGVNGVYFIELFLNGIELKTLKIVKK